MVSSGCQDASGDLGSCRTPLQPGCPMCTPQLLLLTVVVLMLPDAARPQPSSPAQALPTSSALGPVTPEVATAATPDWSEDPTPGTPSVPENATSDSFPALPICICDLTPDTCDLNCCCDKDCDLLHPRTVFSFCLPGSVRDLASSCTSEPALDAATYYNFMVLKVLYDIETNGTFGIQKVSVSFRQTNLTVRPGVSLQQDFTIHFRALGQHMAALPAGPRSGNPGYLIGKPLLALTGDLGHSMTLLQSEGSGICSVKRHEVQFGVNTVSGCKFRPNEVNCSHLQEEIYQALHGRPRPEHVAIFGNADPAQKGGWTRILSRNCSVTAANGSSCCLIPVSLEIQVLWAHIGLQSNPQAHVAGARFLYQCKSVQEHQRGIEVPLTTLVNFVDITQKPEPPRDQPQTDWKLPFDFFFPFKVAFSRGVRAQDSASPVLVLCIFLLGVLSSQTR
ncbi:hypothetical protein ACRRTK_011799 [Alexandromys fortis]